MSRKVSERRIRIGTVVVASLHLVLVAATVWLGYRMAESAVGDGERGAAVWYRSLAVLTAVPLTVLAGALFRVRSAPPQLARRLTRIVWECYVAILGLAVVAVVAVVAGFAGGFDSMLVMILAVFSGVGMGPATLELFKRRSAGSASDVIATPPEPRSVSR